MTNTISNATLLSGEFDDDPDTFVLPTRLVEKPVVEALQEEIKPLQVTKPQDAVNRSTAVPPQLVEEVMTNVELLRPVARSMAAINLHNLFLKVQHPNSPAKDRLEFQQVLNKMSGLTEVKDGGKGGDSGPGFSITINIPGSDKSVTVDSVATVVSEQ